MDYNMDRKLAGLLHFKGCDRWYEVQLVVVLLGDHYWGRFHYYYSG